MFQSFPSRGSEPHGVPVIPNAYEDKVRHLVIVHGDQLNADSVAFDDFDREADAVLMMEVAEEASYVPQHKIRLVLFFSAMRHFRDALRAKGLGVHYVTLDDPNNRDDVASEIKRWVNKTRPDRLVVAEPGDHRVLELDRAAARETGVVLEVREDRHFIASHADFDEFADGRRKPRHGIFLSPASQANRLPHGGREAGRR